jgi:acyl-CoA synthetase (AMP-forming)/AMP-acid ligase II
MPLAGAEAPVDRVVVTERRLSVDYRRLATRSLGSAEALADAHIRPVDRVAVLLRRGADAAAAAGFFGVLAGGAVVVTVNETLRPGQIDHILGHPGAKALLFTAKPRRLLT